MIKVKAIETIHDSRISNTSSGQHGFLHPGHTGETSEDAAKNLEELGFVEIVKGSTGENKQSTEKKNIDSSPENKMRKINKSTKKK